MSYELALTAFATLFVVIDPIGLAPLFMTMTDGLDQKQKRLIAIRSIFVAAAILAIFGIVGEALLAKVGISMAAFRIAGGILLFITAIEMLFSKRTSRKEENVDMDTFVDPSVFPLALPLISGPGSIATMILLMGQNSGDLGAQATIYGVMLALLFITLLMFFAAGYLSKVMGPTLINVISRLLGMLLAALSVQFVLDGLRDFGMVPA